MPLAVIGAVICWNFMTKARCARSWASLATGSCSSSAARTKSNTGASLAARSGDGPFDITPVGVGHRIGHVGPIDRKAGDHLGERLANVVKGEVARAAVGAGDARQL